MRTKADHEEYDDPAAVLVRWLVKGMDIKPTKAKPDAAEVHMGMAREKPTEVGAAPAGAVHRLSRSARSALPVG